ncbi:MAG: LptA/OstA family protein [bacterium]
MRKNILLFLPFIFVSTVVAQKPKEPVNITGERMEVLRRAEITRFLGNVRLIREKDVITSDIMEHYEKKNYIIGKGNVHVITYPEESIRMEAFSDRLTYNVNSNESILTGNPELIRIDEENPEDRVKVEGEVIKLFGKEKRIHVEGDARVEHGEITATGKVLDYDYETKRIVLSGDSPHIYQDNEQVKGDYWAEVITMFIDEERVTMEGNVKASIYPKNR